MVVALVNDRGREIFCKVVYFGARSVGKTTNVAQIYRQAPAFARGEVLTVPIHADPAVTFDVLPLEVGSHADYRVRFYLLTAPGGPFEGPERAALLNGVDGVVLVVDSQRDRFADNLRSALELTRLLEGQHRSDRSLPLVVQYNKRDRPDAVPIPILEARLNPTNAPSVEAAATSGVGVFATLQQISQLILERL